MRERLADAYSTKDLARQLQTLDDLCRSQYQSMQLIRSFGWMNGSAAPVALEQEPITGSASEPAYLVQRYCGQCHAPDRRKHCTAFRADRAAGLTLINARERQILRSLTSLFTRSNGPTEADVTFINQIPLPIQLYVPLMVAALLVAALIGLLALAFHDRRTWASFQRGRLGRRLRGLRMNRMIGVRGIARELYVQLTPIAVLRKDLDTCLNCLSKARCDTSYIVGVESNPALSYCPNTPSLDWAWGKRRC